MSSEEPIRSVPDELFRKVSAKAERQLPDALFGGPPPAARESEAQAGAASSGAGESGGSAESSAEEADAGEADDDRSVAAVSAEAATGVQTGARADGDEPVVARSGAVESAVGDSDGPAGAAEGNDSASAGTAEDDSEVSVVGGEPVAVTVDDASALAESSALTGVVVESAAVAVASGDGVAMETSPAPAGPPALTGSAVGSNSVAVDAVAVGAFGAPAGSPALTGAVVESSAAAAESGDAVAGDTSEAPAPAVAADSTSPIMEPVADESDKPDATARPVLLVLADSLAYFGPKGGLPADDPRIWPNLVAAELDWDVELVARIGWTCRDAYWALIGDPRVWAAVPRAGAVVFAVGGMDSLPSPLPTALRELIRYVRPPALRRAVRASYNWLQPKLSKLGRPVALPPKVSVDYLEQSRTALAQLRPDLPVVAVLPSVHNCDAYGRVHSGRPRAVAALQAWSERTSVPLVDLADAVRDNIFSGEANPDGIHWGWAGHTAVANAMVKTLQEVR